MAKTTEYTYEGDGIINAWAVPFAYLKKTHVKVYIDGVEDTTFTWLTDSSVAATSTPADGAVVVVKRVTPRDALDTVLGNSGTFRGNDINNQSRQALYVAEEGYDALVGVLQLDTTTNEWDFQSYQSKNIPTPTSDDSAANKAYVDAVAGSASAAAASATAAAASASAASTSATNASNSASAAATSATSASGSASTATTKATEAAASATAADASETAAAASETAAAASATAAAASATAAGNAQTAAETAQTAAETAQTAAELALDTFDDIWLGSKTSAPTLDNDGNALQQGALYWNSTSDDLWIYNAGAWEVAALPMSGSYVPPSDDGAALGSTSLKWSDLFLASGAVISFDAGNVTLTHAANVLNMVGNSFKISQSATLPLLLIDRTDTHGPGVNVGGWLMSGRDSAGVYNEYARIIGVAVSDTAGAEEGKINFGVAKAGVGGTTVMGLTSSALSPNANDGTALGTSSLGWSDLFLASGATINFNAGDVTLTHVANTLRMNGGNFNIVGGNNVIGWENGVEGGLWLTKTSQYGTAAVQGIDSSFSAAAIALNPAGGDVLFGTTSAVLNDTIINTQKALAVREQNLIVNSTMHFSQENGDTASSATAGPIAYYGADQWWSGWDVSTSTITGGGLYSAGNGPNRELDRWIYLKSTAAVTYGADEYALFSTKVEGLRWRKLGWGASGAKGAKIGFWVYSSNTTGTMCVAFRETGGNYYYVVDVTVNSAATWEWKEVTIPGPTVGTWSAVNTAAVEISLVFGCGSTFGGATTDAWTAGNKVASSNITNFMAGANHEVRATGVFIVPEDVEFPASVSTYGYLMARLKELEIVECRRYFRQSYADGIQAGTTTSTGQIAFNGGGTQSYHNVHIPFDTKMRAGPTVNVISPVTGASAKLYNATGAADVNANTATTTINGFILRVNNVSLTDVSLQAHYTANARM